MDPARNPGVQIDHIFQRSSSFAHRGQPLERAANTPIPEMQVELEVLLEGHTSGKGGALTLTVRTDPEDDRALYEFSVAYTIVASEIEAEANMTWQDYVTRSGVPTLYPFIRESVANLTSRGRYGPVWLKPINLTSLINQLVASVNEDAAAEAQT